MWYFFLGDIWLTYHLIECKEIWVWLLPNLNELKTRSRTLVMISNQTRTGSIQTRDKMESG